MAPYRGSMTRIFVALLLAAVVVAGSVSAILHSNPGGPPAGPHAPGFGNPPHGVTLPKPQFGVPTVEMFDTVTLSALQGLAPRVLAGYTAGSWPTYLPLVRAYPHAKVISIAIQAGYHARCLDIEPGDASPSQAPGWVRSDRAAGFARPCIYSSLSEWSQIRPYLAGIPRSSYFAWDANWTKYQHLDSGFDATQWTDKAYGRNLDESSVTLAFAGVTPKPVPARLICFGAHGTPRSRACRPIVALYQRRLHAASATEHALRPLLSAANALRARDRWYRSHAAALVKQFS